MITAPKSTRNSLFKCGYSLPGITNVKMALSGDKEIKPKVSTCQKNKIKIQLSELVEQIYEIIFQKWIKFVCLSLQCHTSTLMETAVFTTVLLDSVCDDEFKFTRFHELDKLLKMSI